MKRKSVILKRRYEGTRINLRASGHPNIWPRIGATLA